MNIVNSEEEDEEQEALRVLEGKPFPRLLSLCFLGEKLTMKLDIKIDSDQIAPLGMYTDAWEWRQNLKKGDIIDTCDEYHSWFHGHVADRRTVPGEEKDCMG